jgi:c-di-GMP-binding flagellar brake protein YcgR
MAPGGKMDIKIGDKMTLRFDPDDRKVEGVYVGAEEPNFMIVRLPKVLEEFQVRKGDDLTATCMNAGTIYKAQLSVLEVIEKLDLLVLSYPESYETTHLRKEPRISCQIPATARIEQSALKGLITDISNHGCQFIFKIPATFKPHRVSILTDINISLAAIGQTDPTQLKGKVRNTNIDAFKIVLGIEFERLEEQIAYRLKEFVENLNVFQKTA